MTARIITLAIGDREVEVMVQPMTTLQAVLRDQLGLTSVKEGCRQGGCGSCTVLLDGEPVPSCLVPAEDAEGRRVTTAEGLAAPGLVHPVAQAFLDELGYQCGYCTPGMVMVSVALLEHHPAPSRAEVLDALAGNVCRCTGYAPIIAAVERAARTGNVEEPRP